MPVDTRAELSASMVGVSMLSGGVGIFSLSAESGSALSGESILSQTFIASIASEMASSFEADLTLSFVAEISNSSGASLDASSLLEFIFSSIDSSSAASIDMEAWMQMTHLAGDIAQEAIDIYDDNRVIVVIY